MSAEAIYVCPLWLAVQWFEDQQVWTLILAGASVVADVVLGIFLLVFTRRLHSLEVGRESHVLRPVDFYRTLGVRMYYVGVVNAGGASSSIEWIRADYVNDREEIEVAEGRVIREQNGQFSPHPDASIGPGRHRTLLVQFDREPWFGKPDGGILVSVKAWLGEIETCDFDLGDPTSTVFTRQQDKPLDVLA